MGLFDKKYCDVCGNKIGLLGNRKLEDGNLCKDCAAKLSPWFSERRSSTVEDIKSQLAYREENRAKVQAFSTTRSFGQETHLCLDEDNGKFMIERGDNPDVLDFTQVTGCDLKVEDSRSEEKYRDAEGHMVSYNPPRYTYSYNFYVVIRVNHPWFDEMKLKLNRSSVEIKTGGGMAGGMGAPGGRPPMGGQRPPMNGQRPPMGGFSVSAASTTPDVANNYEYQQYVAMADEIKQALMQVRQQARDNIAAANAPKTAVTCPFCGASTIPDANGCCEYCGGAVNG